MFVVKRDGSTEEMKFDKVTNRVNQLCFGLDLSFVNPTKVAQKVISSVTDMISTSQLDSIASSVAADLVWMHPDYSLLSGRIAASNLQKETCDLFSEAMKALHENGIISDETWEITQKYEEILNGAIVTERDFEYDIFGFETLKKSYFLRVGEKIHETPQYMMMRMSIGIIGDNIEDILELYGVLSKRLYTHATPTIFNAGTPRDQLASCFLVAMKDDSLEGIMDTAKECAQISKYAGGIGVHVHNIRATGSHIVGTNGASSGLIPFLRIYNAVALAFNQGGKRKGSFAIYLEPHHADIELFIELRKNNGDEELRCRDLFLCIWTSDLFMERVNKDERWSLFSPDAAPGLSDVYGDDYVQLYEKYEREGKATRVISARELWISIINCQIETGTPYLVNKDQANLKSNQSNIGTIKSSNLCVAGETLILTDTGYHPIGELSGEEVNVWNGEEWSNTTVVQTGVNQPLVKVVLSNGSTIECTPYHNFYIETESRPIDAKSLQPGMKLIKHDLPVVEDPAAEDFPYAYTAGFSRSRVPINYSIKSKLEWLAGVCDSDGTVASNQSIHLSSIHVEYLTNIMYMLQTMGIHSRMCETNRLSIDDTQKLVEMGFAPKRLSIVRRADAQCSVKVVSVIDEGRTDDTFCFTEKKRGMGMFGGVLTGQCAEILEVSTPDEIAACNLANICLPRYFDDNGEYDYQKLSDMAGFAVKNLNKVIDRSFYPVDSARRSNKRHRPLGLGVSGLHDVFHKMKIAFDSPEAADVNKKIFESIYRGAIIQSINEAKVHGPYSSFAGSKASEGKFQFDLWDNFDHSSLMWDDWNDIRADMVKYGLRNSLLTALMPTASSATIAGVTECFEIQTSNLYSRKVLSGQFTVINKYLVTELIKLGLWNEPMSHEIMRNEGSVATVKGIPDDIKRRYRTVWEYSMRTVIDMSADRAPFVCQTQSLNMYMSRPTVKKMNSMFMYAHEKKLKTLMYYLHTKASAAAIKFTVGEEEECVACSA